MNRSYNFSHWGATLPKASCLCLTYGRPHLLGEAIESFLRQDYPGEKELIVLNDHPDMPLVLADFPGVKLVNHSVRFNSLGEKRNALAAMATGGILFPWDDDDISLPWRLSATLERMTNCHYFKPTDYWWWTGAGMEHHRGVMAHAMSAYSRALFEGIGGYPDINSGEDQGFEARVHSSGMHASSELGLQDAFYIYRLNHVHTYHISAHDFGGGWEQCAEHVEREIGSGSRTVEPAWNVPYEKLAANHSLPTADMPETDDPAILVGICSCHKNSAKRVAVRDTWLADLTENMSARFFVGQGTAELDEPDTVVLDVPDDYDSLPAKVVAFFKYALENHRFDHLFKCDDDTYLAPERLTALARRNRGIVGNIRLEDQGFACGGAGYLLSREWVEAVVRDSTIPSNGYEDRLITRAAMRAGAAPTVCRQLLWNTEDFPRFGNEVISAHWCTPGALRTIHAYRQSNPLRVIEVVHPEWHDFIDLFADGRFSRTSKPDGGRWTEKGDAIELHWYDWPAETAVPADPVPPPPRKSGSPVSKPIYRCLSGKVETITIELSGGMGNQLFQYAHGLALARRTGASLRATYGDYARAFSLGLFGIIQDDEPPEPTLIVEDFDSRATGQDWPTFDAICRSLDVRHVRVRGFFQHETYFANVAPEIRKLLEPACAALETRIETLVCVHVRRGDFVGCHKHGVCRLEYYLLAMKIIRGLVPCPHFQIFSDEPEWCLDNFPPSADVTVLERMPEGRALELMSRCGTFVLSNSTFGWWAAWLSNSGPVLAPNRFLATCDWNICPDSWIQIPSDGRLPGFEQMFSLDKPSTGETTSHPWPIITISGHSFRADLLRDKNVVIDLGACQGEFLDGLEDHCVVETAILVEPSVKNIAAIRRGNNRILYQKLCGANDGEPVCFREDDNSPYNGSVMFDYFNGPTYLVGTVSLGHLMEECGVEHVDILKIDIEGSEYELMESLDDRFFENFTQISVEFHDFVDPSLKPRTASIVDRISRLGFKMIAMPTEYRFGSQHFDVLFFKDHHLLADSMNPS